MRNLIFCLLFLCGCTKFLHRKDWIVIENYSSPNANCYYLFSKEIYFTENSLYWYSKNNKKEIFQYKVIPVRDYTLLNKIEKSINFDLKKCKNGESVL